MAAKVKSFFRNEEVFLLFQGGGIKKSAAECSSRRGSYLGLL